MGKVVVVVEPHGRTLSVGKISSEHCVATNEKLNRIKKELQDALGQDAKVVVSPLGVHLRVIAVE